MNSLSEPVRVESAWPASKRAGSSWAETWLGMDRRARIVTDAQLRLVWSSPEADAALARTRALSLRAGAVVARDPEALARLRRSALGVANGRRSTERLALSDESDALTLIVQAIPSEERPLIGLTLRFDRPLHGLDLSEIREEYGLTSGEERVLALLATGRSVAEISEALDNSVHTVRTHIKRIYAKLDVGTKEQLFAKLLELLA